MGHYNQAHIPVLKGDGPAFMKASAGAQLGLSTSLMDGVSKLLC